MAFFKSADEKFEQGNEFIKRKEYDKARKAFDKAISKGTSESEVARVMIALLDLRGNNTANLYSRAADVLKEKGELEVEFGLFTIKCSKLALECSAMAAELNALSMPASGADALKARADALFAAAMTFKSSIGAGTLIVPEVYTASKITGIEKASNLMAEGNENMAESVAMEDPKKAAEYFQMALNYRRQLQDTNAESRIQEKIKLYAKAAACWICGRETTGETIHFVSMPADITPMQRNSKQSSPLPSIGDRASIYVCRACYSAVSKRADAIAQKYHNIALTEIRNAEARLDAKINSLSARIR